jgi:hypothetical protein
LLYIPFSSVCRPGTSLLCDENAQVYSGYYVAPEERPFVGSVLIRHVDGIRKREKWFVVTCFSFQSRVYSLIFHFRTTHDLIWANIKG